MQLLTAPAELLFWGPRTYESQRYLLDANNSASRLAFLFPACPLTHTHVDTTILTIHIGHFLTVLEHVLGPLASLTASSTSRFLCFASSVSIRTWTVRRAGELGTIGEETVTGCFLYCSRRTRNA